MKKLNKINFKYNLKLYFKLLNEYKWLSLILIFLILLIEAARVVDKFLFKEVIDKGTEFAAENLPKNEFIQILTIILLIYVSVVIFKALAHWMKIHLINILESNLILTIKQRLFNHVIGLSHNFHTSNKTGSLISKLIRGGSATERMTDVIVFNVVPLLFQLCVVSLSLLYFDILSSIVVLGTVLTFIGYSFFILKFQIPAKVRANETEDFEKANLADYLTNIDSIKYFGKDSSIKTRFKHLSTNSKKTLVKYWNFYRWLDLGQSLILGTGILLLMYFPIKKFLTGDLTLGTLVFIYTVFGNLMGPLFGFIHGVRGFFRSMADFESLFKYLRIENEVKDLPHSKNLKIRRGTIEFKNITFGYGRRKIFKNFNLKIRKNTKVALVGHSGCGKSTLIKLLYRMYDIEKGEILIDGRGIKDYKQKTLRSELSIVPQECVLFDDTISNNIAFSKPQAKKKEVKNAIKFAQLDKIILTFPDKDKTIVGERGVKLSGGEKQRVSIARALLANKKVLVLDEATSSLDSQTEHDIQTDLENLMKGRTSIIIAHRLSTIMHADQIIVLEKGKIVQTGTHKELIRRKGEYKKLWELQKGGYIK